MDKRKNKVTEFGKICRKVRINHDMVLKDMADLLGVSPAYLSAVENGLRKIPKNWGDILINNYDFSDEEKNRICQIIETQNNDFFDEFNLMKNEDRNMIVKLARKCQDITPEKYNQIMKILGEENKNESKT